MYNIIDVFLRSLYDLFWILRCGNWFSLRHFCKHHTNNSLKILGNGSSLNNADINYDESDIMVLNRHVVADNYTIIKPHFYIIADPHFFVHIEGLGILDKISEKTTWEMVLFVPYSKANKEVIKKHIINNNIKLVLYNSSVFEGYKYVAYKLYNLQLAMPRVQNVLVAAIMIGIIMKFERIELYGVEHSWTKYLTVGDDNLVYLYNPHFYDKDAVAVRPIKDIHNQQESPFWFVLECYMKMFKSYTIIKDYVLSEKKNVKIINRTPNSFIDAFDRE